MVGSKDFDARAIYSQQVQGPHTYYAYYHCTLGCRHRTKAELAHDIILQELRKYTPLQAFKSLYRSLILEAFHTEAGEQVDARKKVLREISDFEQRISRARDLVATTKIEPEDFREMKKTYSANIEKLEAKLNSLSAKTDVEGLLKVGLEQLMQLDYCYEKGNVREKRMLIGSIFPENLVIEEQKVRTARVNDVVQIIYLINKALGGKKNGQRAFWSSLSSKVLSGVRISNHFLEDLRRLCIQSRD